MQKYSYEKISIEYYLRDENDIQSLKCFFF